MTTANLATAGCGELPSAEQVGRTDATVERVVDGDTLVLDGVGRSRLIGIDTPETHGERECFGPAATAYVERLLRRGARVEYRLGIEPRDRYGRALVWLWLPDGRLLNDLLASEGYAVPLAIPPNVERAGRIARLAGTARRERRGLWDPRRCPRGP